MVRVSGQRHSLTIASGGRGRPCQRAAKSRGGYLVTTLCVHDLHSEPAYPPSPRRAAVTGDKGPALRRHEWRLMTFGRRWKKLGERPHPTSVRKVHDAGWGVATRASASKIMRPFL
jgi:hypothetical protein